MCESGEMLPPLALGQVSGGCLAAAGEGRQSSGGRAHEHPPESLVPFSRDVQAGDRGRGFLAGSGQSGFALLTERWHAMDRITIDVTGFDGSSGI